MAQDAMLIIPETIIMTWLTFKFAAFMFILEKQSCVSGMSINIHK